MVTALLIVITLFGVVLAFVGGFSRRLKAFFIVVAVVSLLAASGNLHFYFHVDSSSGPASGNPSDVAAASPPAAHVTRSYSGITCTWGSRASAGGVICHQSDARGIAIFVSARQVGMKRWRSGRTLYVRGQPAQTARFGDPDPDLRVFRSESHNGVICFWFHATGSDGTLCHRDDHEGYFAIINHLIATVIYPVDQTGYVLHQP